MGGYQGDFNLAPKKLFESQTVLPESGIAPLTPATREPEPHLPAAPDNGHYHAERCRVCQYDAWSRIRGADPRAWHALSRAVHGIFPNCISLMNALATIASTWYGETERTRYRSVC